MASGAEVVVTGAVVSGAVVTGAEQSSGRVTELRTRLREQQDGKREAHDRIIIEAWPLPRCS